MELPTRVLSLPRRDGTAGLLARLGAVGLTLALLLGLLAPLGARAQDDDEGDGLPPGEYAVTLTRDEIPLDLAGGPILVGQWIVSFRDDGTYALTRGDVGEVVTGTYVVDGQTVTITDEGGLLACSVPAPGAPADADVTTATYAWEATGGGEELTLEAIEDGCEPRRRVLTTRALVPYVACLTVAIALPEASADDEEDEESILDSDAGSGSGSDLNDLGDEDAEEATPVAEEPAADIATADDPEEAIDDLLAQMSACWATRDPARVFPLVTEDHLAELVEGAGSGATLLDVAIEFEPFTAIPVTWELAGELDVDEDGEEASAVVSLQVGTEETFVEDFGFVLTEIGWRAETILGE